MAATKSEQEMGEIVAAGGNLEPGYVFEPATATVRKMTADEAKTADAAVADEAAAARRRADVLKRAGTPVATDPLVAP